MIYLLFGEDTKQSRKVLSGFERRFRDEAPSAWHRIDAGSEDAEGRLRALSCNSLFGGKQYASILSPSLFSEDASELVEKFLKRWETDDSVIVFHESGVPKKNSLFNKLAKAAAKKQEFKIPNRASLFKWLSREISAKKISGGNSLANLLIERFGDNPWRLSSELEKIVLGGDATPKADVFRDADLFALADFWGKREKNAAVIAYRKLLDRGCAPERVLWILLWHIKNLFLASKNKLVGISPFVARKALAQARNFQNAELECAFRFLVNLDGDAKKGAGALKEGIFQFLLVN